MLPTNSSCFKTRFSVSLKPGSWGPAARTSRTFKNRAGSSTILRRVAAPAAR